MAAHMRRWMLLTGLTVIGVGIAVSVMLLSRTMPTASVTSIPTVSAARIDMVSDPFPLSAGPATLTFTLTDANGQPISDARIDVRADMIHQGMLPLNGRARLIDADSGQYEVPLIFTMMGGWTVNISATFPDQRDPIHEKFDIYVYPVQMYDVPTRMYVSERDVSVLITANADRELWIVIPLGTQAMMRMGAGDDLMPEELRLSVNGQNTLVIRNNDIADHTIGPFFVRAGETVRQTFYQPAVFTGVCTVRHGDEINIIVE